MNASCNWVDLMQIRGPIYKQSDDLSYDYLKLIGRSICDSDLQNANISVRNTLS